jgi:hypothetical protein
MREEPRVPGGGPSRWRVAEPRRRVCGELNPAIPTGKRLGFGASASLLALLFFCLTPVFSPAQTARAGTTVNTAVNANIDNEANAVLDNNGTGASAIFNQFDATLTSPGAGTNFHSRNGATPGNIGAGANLTIQG